MSTIIKRILEMAFEISPNDYTRLEVAEFMLNKLVRNPNTSLKIKSEALNKIKEINAEQNIELGA